MFSGEPHKAAKGLRDSFAMGDTAYIHGIQNTVWGLGCLFVKCVSLLLNVF